MTDPIKPATDAEIREIEQRIASGDDNPWSVHMVEALIARVEQEKARADENFDRGDEQYRRAEAAEAEVTRLREGLRTIKAKWEWFWGWVDAYVTNEEHIDAAEAVDEALKDALKER